MPVSPESDKVTDFRLPEKCSKKSGPPIVSLCHFGSLQNAITSEQVIHQQRTNRMGGGGDMHGPTSSYQCFLFHSAITRNSADPPAPGSKRMVMKMKKLKEGNGRSGQRWYCRSGSSSPDYLPCLIINSSKATVHCETEF
jgi:hypothetical protein